MKAAVAGEFRQPPVIVNRPIPSSGRGQVTVHMKASQMKASQMKAPGLYHADMASA
jgi:D-arabinose 1-dehydrogenase-like Zn-dependent alcohol dehydrogenase